MPHVLLCTDLAPLYEQLCQQHNFQMDTALLEKMKSVNKKELDELKAEIEEAKTNAGETEIREATQAVAEYYAHIGDKDNALEWYEETLDKTVGTKTCWPGCDGLLYLFIPPRYWGENFRHVL